MENRYRELLRHCLSYAQANLNDLNEAVDGDYTEEEMDTLMLNIGVMYSSLQAAKNVVSETMQPAEVRRCKDCGGILHDELCVYCLTSIDKE